MSFFGFDTNSPEGSSEVRKSKGFFEVQDPFAQVRQARKLQAFQGTPDEPYVLADWHFLDDH